MASVSPPVFAHRVSNPEELTEAIRAANFEPVMLKRMPDPSWMARVDCPQVCLDFVKLGSSFLFTGVMPENCYTLVFVIDCPLKGNSFNFETEHNDGYMGFFPPGAELDAYTPEGYSNASLTVPVEMFLAAVKTSFPEIPDRLLKSGAGLRIGKREQAPLRALLSAVMRGIENPASPLDGLAARRELERRLLDGFLVALRMGLDGLIPRMKSRALGAAGHLRQAREFIRESSRGPVQLDDLCGNLGISRRGVELIFRKSFGIGPSAFIRQQRLHGVRRALLENGPDSVTVKESAIQWGFLHMGHFSRNYRELFGECPSETLLR